MSKFAPDCANAAEAAASLKPGEVLLLENSASIPKKRQAPSASTRLTPLMRDAKKEMKARQKEFAKTLASYADVYINDAFGTALPQACLYSCYR